MTESLETIVECGKCNKLVVYSKCNPFMQVYHDVLDKDLKQKFVSVYLCNECTKKIEGLSEKN